MAWLLVLADEFLSYLATKVAFAPSYIVDDGVIVVGAIELINAARS